MRLCYLQLQPRRAPSLRIPQVKRVISRVRRGGARRIHTIYGYDRGPYVNFVFETDDAGALWEALETQVLGDPQIGANIANASIVTCQGDRGWDNYILLHHFDARVTLDASDEL
jgi:hypothetical protein